TGTTVNEASSGNVLTTAMLPDVGNANDKPSPAVKQARTILDATGVQGGLIVHLGCGDGRLTAALWANDSYLVHGLDASVANVENTRKHIRSQGLYGPVSIDRLHGKRLPYIDNLVNLMVADDLRAISMDEVMRALCPNGVAYVKQKGQWTKTVKPWPDELDEWTHWLHGPDGNPVARDNVVGPPRQLQWV
ncbi:MAG: class I SAM-dependent methyltransferase, partial [Propionibacteriaceae bacterium]|nr:class I SAM-dependent methyltransferase [Propionibacteriaceae bacterium]